MIPTRIPFYTLTLLVLGLVATVGVWQVWRRMLATPDQAYYLSAYVRSGLPSMPHDPRHGPVMIDVGGRQYPKVAFHEWVARVVYGKGALLIPVYASGVVLLGFVVFGAMCDRRRQRRLFFDGERVRGPELLSERQFNRRRKGDGFRLVVK